jgi:hypothetical protein
MIRLDLSKTKGFEAHRSGWAYCMGCLKPLHSRSGIFVDDFIERAFAWKLDQAFKNNENNIPYQREWIGFLHNPPNVPEWFDFINSPQAILSRKLFQDSLKTCRALITLSDYLKNWLQPQVEVPVVSVKHPTERAEHLWNPDVFFIQKQRPIVQLGYWLRKMFAICELETSFKYSKMWLPSDSRYGSIMMSIEERTKTHFWETKYRWSGVKKFDRIDNQQFDELMSQCIVFLDLYDSSANNAVVESIARNTPILINKIPAVVEYLGVDYPFYFDDYRHAIEKLADDDLIMETHLYLKNMDKRWISGKYFANDLHDKLLEVL